MVSDIASSLLPLTDEIKFYTVLPVFLFEEFTGHEKNVESKNVNQSSPVHRTESSLGLADQTTDTPEISVLLSTETMFLCLLGEETEKKKKKGHTKPPENLFWEFFLTNKQ